MERVIAAMYLIAAVIFGLLSLYEGVQTFLQLVAGGIEEAAASSSVLDRKSVV